jgi:ElaB/YqjD/DUF883 family membrane-anchored ribosome-binding protein
MEETRSSLADKIDLLENQVLGTVETASTAVTDTVEHVKETVSETVTETVETVKEAFNVRKHIENHPWAAFGGSVATGYALGCLLTSPKQETLAVPAPAFTPRAAEPVRAHPNGAAHGNGHAPKSEREEEEEEGGIVHEGVQILKGLALGSVMSLVRNLLKDSTPSSMFGELAGFVNNVTDKLGAKRLWENEEVQEGDSHDERESAKVGRPVGTARW